MKRFLFLLLLLPVLVSAQNCKYERNEVDKFTKKQVLITQTEIAWKNPMGGNSLTFKFKKIDWDVLLWMRYSMPSTFAIEKDSKLFLLTAEGSNIELQAMESKVSSNNSQTSFIEMDYVVTPEILALIRSSLITDIRFYTTDGFIEHTLKENKRGVIASIASCIN